MTTQPNGGGFSLKSRSITTLATYCVMALAGAVSLTMPDSLSVSAAGDGAGAFSGSRVTPTRRAASSSGAAHRGYVTPSRRVELMGSLEETLKSVDVEEGEHITQGQLLAMLDDGLQEMVTESARLRAESRAEVEHADLVLEEARETYDLCAKAFERGAVTDHELTRTRTELARAEVAQRAALENKRLAEVNLELEQRRLQRYRVVAPFDGTVVRIDAEPGAMMTLDDTILVIADLYTLHAHVNIPARLYGELAIGSSYMLRADAPVNAELSATLTAVSPIIDPASQTFQCEFAIANDGAKLPAGFAVQLTWPPRSEAPMVQVPTD
jgi:RND family efflux transporter MFP subunit